VIEPRNTYVAVADVLSAAEGESHDVAMAWRRDPAGVGEHGTFARGSHRNLGGPGPLRSNDPVGAPEDQSPGPRRFVLGPAGANERARLRYHQAKAY
jgi:hypothetical protein